MRQRGEFQDAIAFADTDALRALEAITRQRPNLVVIESAFAATSRGTALINRIKADPSLSRCEVRLAAHTPEPDAPAEPVVADVVPDAAVPDVVSAAAAAPPLSVPAPAPSAPAVPEARPTVSFPLDHSGTRRAPRYEMTDGLEVLVDGSPATLLDLSIEGAQMISLTTLRPNQRVRLTLPGLAPLRISGEIAWAIFEMSQGVPRYRVGMAFAAPDTNGVQRFIEGNAK